MKKQRSLLFLFFTLIYFFSSIQFSGCQDKKNFGFARVAIAGIAIESSTFSPAQTDIDAFRIKRGEEIFSSYPFLATDSVDQQRAEWFPALRGRAIPGGIVTREAYESMVTEILERLKKKDLPTMDCFSIFMVP